MPGKSKHGRRNQHKGKKRRGRQSFSTVSPQQTVVSQAYQPAPSPEVTTPSASGASTRSAMAATRYPYIATELRRIGILAGIILVILIILALIFS